MDWNKISISIITQLEVTMLASVVAGLKHNVSNNRIYEKKTDISIGKELLYNFTMICCIIINMKQVAI